MSRPSGFSRRPLRLVQPFDDDTDVPRSALQSTSNLHTSAEQRPIQSSYGSNPSPMHLTSLRPPSGAEAGKGTEVEGHPTAIRGTQGVKLVTPSLHSFPTRNQHTPGTRDVAADRSHRESCDARGAVLHSAQSSAGPPMSRLSASADRLAALYQQYQIPPDDKQNRERGDAFSEKGDGGQVRSVKTPTPPPAPSATNTRPVVAGRRPVRGGGGGDRLSDAQRQNRVESLSSVTDSDGDARESLEDVAPPPLPTRLSHPSRLFTSDSPLHPAATTKAARNATASPTPGYRPTPREPQGRNAVVLPASLSEFGVSGLMSTAIYVWAALGFFEMRPLELDHGEGGDSDDEGEGKAAGGTLETQSVSSAAAQETSDPREVESFLFAIEDYLNLTCAETVEAPAASLPTLTFVMRNGLWRVLFNAVFYCVSVLDARRRRRGSLTSKEREVRTGGPEDAYEVVFPSSSSLDDDDDGSDAEALAEKQVPVRLTWRVRGESEAARAARCARDPLPPDSALLAGGPPYRTHVHTNNNSSERCGEAGFSSARSHETWASEGGRPQSPPLDLYGGRLRTPIPVSDWYFTLRCLAQVGYRRDVFYLQTPAAASPLELLLALLWLTQQYKLLGIAEYVEMNRRYGFLLQYHADEGVWRRGPGCETTGAAHAAGAASAQETQVRERLLQHLSNATAWPPVSFDENSAIHLRLMQLERCLGRSAPPDESPMTAPASAASSQHVRRLLAVQRLISLSLNRLHYALLRQAEQTALLGLHSPLDAQLCRREHHAVYEEVMAGLAYVRAMEGRLRSAAECLGKAGSLVGFLLRYDESGVSAEEVLLALEEDDATWLDSVADNGDDDEGGASATGVLRGARPRCRDAATSKKATSTAADRWQRAVRRGTLPATSADAGDAEALPTSAAALAQSLSTFRATQARGSLVETWKRLLRRSHVAPQTIPPENLRFLLDTEAQQIQEARVRENMASRYSLQAALAAELAVLGYEQQQQRRQRSPSHSPLKREERGAAETSASSRRTADADADAAARPVRVALPAMELVTNATTAFAQLQAEDAAYGPVLLSTAELQLTEVGEPAAGSTTSARLELERLRAWEVELDAQLGVQAQTAARVAHCKKMLESLYHDFGLRMATPLVQRKPQSQR